MITFLTILHVVVCLFLIIVVLLQSGKAADLAGAFGGMGSQTAFGPRGAATILSKATTTSAVIFMVTSILLGALPNDSIGGGGSVIEKTGLAGEAPATPAPIPTPGSGVQTIPIPAPPQQPADSGAGSEGLEATEVEVTPAEGGSQ